MVMLLNSGNKGRGGGASMMDHFSDAPNCVLQVLNSVYLVILKCDDCCLWDLMKNIKSFIS